MNAGALGGTQCAYATCFAKLLSKPLITIVHSVHHNIDDPLQVLTGGPCMAGCDGHCWKVRSNHTSTDLQCVLPLHPGYTAHHASGVGRSRGIQRPRQVGAGHGCGLPASRGQPAPGLQHLRRGAWSQYCPGIPQ